MRPSPWAPPIIARRLHGPVTASSHMPGLTIDQLIFKGTHNSYACRGRHAPWMNHPPETQIDDFGVWGLELDYSMLRERGGPVAVVGHNWEQDAACWGYYLTDYVERILGARALNYRPVFLYLEAKTWKRRWRTPWRQPTDQSVRHAQKWEAALDALTTTCGDRLVVLEAWLAAHEGVWPSPLALAGKVVLYEPNFRDPAGRLAGLPGMHATRSVTARQVEDAIELGRPLERNGARSEGGARLLRLDQYQADWTFDYGVPPNPIVVDPRAPTSAAVTDAQGRPWRCGVERSHGAVVHEHGTYRFPYRDIASAIERARGITPATRGTPDARRAGYGWTLLLRGGEPVPELPDDLQLRVEIEPA